MVSVRAMTTLIILGLVLTPAVAGDWDGVTAFVTNLDTSVPVNPANTSIMAVSPDFCSPPRGPIVPTLGTNYCNNTGFISLSAFASAQNSLTSIVSSLNTRIDSSFAAIAVVQNQIVDLNNRVNAINARLGSMNADISRSLEIGAIAASMRDAIPNPGDRFAIRLNAAGFNGYAGGSLGVSVSVTDSIRLSANYGRGATQNVVSGGLNVSFR